MKVRVQFGASEAASAAQAFVERCTSDGELGRAAQIVEREIVLEEAWTDRIVELLGELPSSAPIDYETSAGQSDEGDSLNFTLEGELDFELEALLDTRRNAKVFGDALLDVIALFAPLELTTVKVKIGGRRSSLEALSDAIVRHAGELSVFLTPARERSVADLCDAGAEDELDDDDDDDDDLDGDDDDLDGEDDEDSDEDDSDEDVDDDDEDDDGGARADGIPADGWGARPSAPRHSRLSADEQHYLEVAQLTYPCTLDALRSSLRRVAHYHPDLVQHDPALRAVRHEQFARLTQAYTALVARLRKEVR